ncbi:nitroreductase family protein [Rhodococcus hoagii]|uniref:nitroreductase family protein n=1 Tax=Rhodococcus hoagii TaxID=43767 RepID=UPI0019653AF9|nr:nitroreductase family protein [Prescottella equi]MBM9838427.1 nitroreductase family protein [Prescottella equi]
MLAASYWADWRRFRTHSGMGDRGARGLRAEIVMDAHRLEKGLALPRPREWFGRDVIGRLLDNTEKVCGRAPLDEVDHYVVTAAVGALDAYFDSNDSTGGAAPDWVSEARDRAAKLAANNPARVDAQLGGVEPIGPSAAEASGVTAESFAKFVRSRHSVRNFALDVPSRSVIEDAVALAATSPSVCNRQGSRVRIFERGPQADAVLAHQNGNKGFGHTASHVLVVSQDIEAFVAPGERSQAFVDGGMFAMSLMYSLHAAGLGACALNWSRTAADDRRLRAELSLPPNEVVVTLMVVGVPAGEILVTRSPSRPVVIS